MAEAAKNLKITDDWNPEPMPLVNVKVPRLFAAMWAEWRDSKYFTDHVSGAAMLAFMSMPQSEQLRWINEVDRYIRESYDIPPQDTEAIRLMASCPVWESELWTTFINDHQIGTGDPFEVADPTDDDDDATRD